MKGRILTQQIIYEFKEHLISEERSGVTVEKYIRDVKAFAVYVNGAEITKETVTQRRFSGFMLIQISLKRKLCEYTSSQNAFHFLFVFCVANFDLNEVLL